MKLQFPEMKEHYDYIIENIIPEITEEDDGGWFNEYIDYLVDNMLKDLETIKTYKYRAEKIEKLTNNLTEKQRLEQEQGMKELDKFLNNK